METNVESTTVAAATAKPEKIKKVTSVGKSTKTTTVKPVTKSAPRLTKGTTVNGTNGIVYKVSGKGKVKKVGSLDAILNLDIETISDINTLNKTLYRKLKDKEPSDETRIKSGWVYCKGFKMRYSDKGFLLIDNVNFGEDLSDSFTDMPTPQDVWDFISVPKASYKPRIKVTDPRTTELKPKMDLAEAKKLILSTDEVSEFKVRAAYKKVIIDTEIAEDVKEYFRSEMQKKFPYLIPKEELDINKLRKRALRIVTKETKPLVVITKLKGLIPNRSYNVFYNKLIKKFKNKEIRAPKFISEVTALLKNDEVFSEKREPAKKFVGSTSYIVHELVSVTDSEVTFKNSSGTFTVSKSAFIAHYVLEEYPELNIGVMKLLRKEITQEQFIGSPVIKDKYCDFDYSLLKSHNQELYDSLIDIMLDWELDNPLLIVYGNNFPEELVGTTIWVTWLDYSARYKAKVIDTKQGVKLRYDDGTVTFLYSFQPYKQAK
jgi:hypothetical protein